MAQLTGGAVSLAVFNDMRARYNAYVLKNKSLPDKIYTVSGGSDYVSLEYFDVMVANKDRYGAAYNKEPETIWITTTPVTFKTDPPKTTVFVPELGYFVNPEATPYTKIDFVSLKNKGINCIYYRIFNDNYTKHADVLSKIKAAGLKPYAWVWEGFKYGKELAALGWNICIDVENYNMSASVPALKQLRADTKGRTLIICTKPTLWDGDQKWEMLIPICDYIMPMLYLGDYKKTMVDLVEYMSKYNKLYPGKIYPALETYKSDANPVPKDKDVLQAEIAACKPYSKGIGLFRYGLTSLEKENLVMVTVKQIQARLKELGFYTGVVDGIAGPYTIAAIKLFQKSKGLLQDGIVGPITLKALGLSDTAVVTATPTPTPVTTSDIQKKIIAGTGKTFTTFSQFYSIVKTNCSYAYYFNGRYNADNAVAMLIKDINGSATGLNCVDYTQIGVKLAQQMGYTAIPYGIWCSGDQINHAIFLIKGKEFGTSGQWIDLSAAAKSNYNIGNYWCSGAKTARPSWIPLE